MKSQLLFTTAMLFIMITAASHAATLYVDATNKGAADGSQAKPFNTIQKGIDAAKSGDTVQVAAGTYEGPIQFKDGITLQGAGAAVTKITITVVNDNAIIYVTNAKSGVIDGFTIIGGGPISSGLNLSRSDITITNNVVTNINEYGLYAWSSKPTISNNQFVGNRNTGIWLKRSNAIVTDNVINENGGGIVCEDRANTTITNNEISLNQNEGIAFSSFSAPTIRNNRIIDNDGRGINAYSASATIEDNNIISGNGYIGIEGDSSDMTIRKNKIVENARSGIRLSASNPTISENEIRGNGEFGIWLLSNSGGSVRDNTITENAGGGIGCEGSSPTIEHNTVTDNADAGIACGGAANPTLANNTLSFNGREGIRFDWGSQAGATITGNQIIGNGGEGGIGIWSLNHEAIIITGNKISENSGDGVHIGFAEIVSTGVQIRDNQITDNSGKGIANHTGRAQIRGNLITRNLGNGVWMGDGALPDLGTTADAGSNAIYGNRNSSQLWNSTPNEIQAVGNYWGKGTENEGPKNLIGNDAGGNVLFEPWLKVEPPPPVISGNVLSFTWPARNESGTGRFQIAWQDGDVAKGTLSLYYDTDRVGHDGTPIPGAANIPLSDPKNQYVWEPSGLPIGATYYLYAEINDGAGNLSYVYSTGSMTLGGGGGTTRGTFNLTLLKGLNMVSLPVRPDTSYTAQTLIDKLNATVLTKFDATRQKFIPYLPGISNDFPIEGGAGYIVNVTEGKTVPFTGTVWDNTSAAPSPTRHSERREEFQPVWAFVVGGELRSNDFSRSTLTVRNLRTGQILHFVQDDGVRYAVVFADVNRRSVVEAGDVLEVGIDGVDGRVHYTVTPEDLRRAFARIDIDPQFLWPAQTVLLQNYPNPFNPETWMPYQLASDATVQMTIYDTRGALVRRLALGHQRAGYYQERSRAAHWDGRNETGERVSSGVYFYQLKAGDVRRIEPVEITATRRMVIIK